MLKKFADPIRTHTNFADVRSLVKRGPDSRNSRLICAINGLLFPLSKSTFSHKAIRYTWDMFHAEKRTVSAKTQCVIKFVCIDDALCAIVHEMENRLTIVC